MKNRLLVTILLFQVQLSYSQDKTFIHPTTGQFFLSGSQFRTPSRALKIYPGFGFNYTKGLQPRLDWGATVNLTMADSVMKHKEGFNAKQPLIEFDLTFRYRFLPPSQLVQPYITTGLGVSAFKTYLGQYFLIGTGAQIKALENVGFLSLDKVSIVVNVQRRLRMSNTLSNHNIYSVGLAGNIGKLIKERPVPTIELNSIPSLKVLDKDDDGIVDSLDFCPDVRGLTAYQGCPDTDQDGVSDNHDKCPSTVGLEKYHGCPVPDSDGDGINDDEDKCATTSGLLKYQGCPIPDSDNDGVNDEVDSCINEAGIVELHGCPPVTKEVKAAVDIAAKNIFFKLASFELLPASFASLDEVAKILSENPDLLLDIEGHSDSIGSSRINKQLSSKRASAIFDYLVSKGVEPDRIMSVGYGSEKPIADNDSEEGRGKNRRVELKLRPKQIQ
ncbi:MAG TPA: OmpA family protein [Chitinophagaceae bacterium]|nr:OmpA family protein [Chitinophagaceae bacterium]